MNITTIFFYIIWDVNSDIFTIPYVDHPVKWYGIAWALGFLVGQQIMYYIYRRDGRDSKEVDTLTLYILFAGFLGARLGHFLFYDPGVFLSDPLQIVLPPYAGLASHGGGIGVLIAVYFFARRTNSSYLWVVDRLAIVTALAGCFIRLGNLMNSEMIGIPTNVPWAFVFTAVDDIPRHPAQLYEAIYSLLLFLLLFGIWYKKGNGLNNGFVTGLFLIIMFSLRFFDEFLKIDQSEFESGMLINMGQILSIPYMMLGIWILWMSRRNENRKILFEDSADEKAETNPGKI